MINKDSQTQWRPLQKKKTGEIYYEASIKSRDFKMKLIQTSNLTYFLPEERNIDPESMMLDFFQKDEGRKEGRQAKRQEGKNILSGEVKYFVTKV